jgi:hypothetical protein
MHSKAARRPRRLVCRSTSGADRHSDLLYAARISGREALIYFLWEHKSDPESFAPLQVMRYMVHIWDLHLASLPKKQRGEMRGLPVIVPIVLHHGRDGTRALTALFRYILGPESTAA